MKPCVVSGGCLSAAELSDVSAQMTPAVERECSAALQRKSHLFEQENDFALSCGTLLQDSVPFSFEASRERALMSLFSFFIALQNVRVVTRRRCLCACSRAAAIFWVALLFSFFFGRELFAPFSIFFRIIIILRSGVRFFMFDEIQPFCRLLFVRRNGESVAPRLAA